MTQSSDTRTGKYLYMTCDADVLLQACASCRQPHSHTVYLSLTHSKQHSQNAVNSVRRRTHFCSCLAFVEARQMESCSGEKNTVRDQYSMSYGCKINKLNREPVKICFSLVYGNGVSQMKSNEWTKKFGLDVFMISDNDLQIISAYYQIFLHII